MCGFYFRIDRNNLSDDNKYLLIKNKLSPRGSDSFKSIKSKYRNFRYFACHSRLIISGDKNNGSQPYITENHLLMFNGQIYNFRQLEDNYSISKSKSDTEFLSLFFQKFPFEYCCENLQGPFSIVYFDFINNNLFIARDNFGESPLFLKQNRDSLVITSDYSLLQNMDEIQVKNFREINNKLSISIGFPTTENYLKASFPPGNFQEFSLINRSIKKHNKKIFRLRNNILQRKCSVTLNPLISNTDVKKFTDLLLKSILTCTQDYKNYGLLLSSGIDSNLLSICLKKLTIDHKTYSVMTSKEKEFINSDNIIKVNQDQYIKDLLIISKESCNGFFDLATPLVLSIMRKAKEKILLSGDGADEIFLGYRKYKFAALLTILEKIKFIDYRLLNNLYYFIFKKYDYPLKENLTKVFPYLVLSKGLTVEEIILFIKKESNKNNFYNVLSGTNNVDFLHLLPDVFLRKGDFASLISNKQLRLPFLSIQLLEAVLNSKIKTGNKINLFCKQKQILYKSYFYLTGKKFVNRKAGFGMDNLWIKNAIDNYLDKNDIQLDDKKFLLSIKSSRLN